MRTTTLRTVICLAALLLSGMMQAAPARRGVWTTITLTDGSQVKAQVVGDEFYHYWADASGNHYTPAADGRFVRNDEARLQAMRTQAVARRARWGRVPSRQRLAPRKAAPSSKEDAYYPSPAIFQRPEKGLVILVEFGGTGRTAYKFATDLYPDGDVRAFFDRVANERGFAEGNYVGSVRDYFLSQSNGLFDLTFDVVGPITADNNSQFYAGNDGTSKVSDLLKEVCQKADDLVDFSRYDWDGDGEVEEVFFVYAGYGQADTGDATTIWPHMALLDDSNVSLTLDGVKINTYACANEAMRVGGRKTTTGIGVICHEYSHCMGFPDIYDINYSGDNFGMGEFDLMDGGEYNGNTFIPAGYSGYEKMVCGWQAPIVLTTPDSIKNVQPLSRGGNFYLVYCENPDSTEYYYLENRQPTGWDAGLPGYGLLIGHVDFDANAWFNNIPNTIVDFRSWSRIPGYEWCATYYNTHPRLTMFNADNNFQTTLSGYGSNGTPQYLISSSGQETDLYPYLSNDSLTVNSQPAAIQYKGGSSAQPFAGHEITAIKQYDDGTMSFVYRRPVATGIRETVADAVSGRRSGVYNLNGQRVADRLPQAGLAPGLYIVDGRKQVVR